MEIQIKTQLYDQISNGAKTIGNIESKYNKDLDTDKLRSTRKLAVTYHLLAVLIAFIVKIPFGDLHNSTFGIR